MTESYVCANDACNELADKMRRVPVICEGCSKCFGTPRCQANWATYRVCSFHMVSEVFRPKANVRAVISLQEVVDAFSTALEKPEEAPVTGNPMFRVTHPPGEPPEKVGPECFGGTDDPLAEGSTESPRRLAFIARHGDSPLERPRVGDRRPKEDAYEDMKAHPDARWCLDLNEEWIFRVCGEDLQGMKQGWSEWSVLSLSSAGRPHQLWLRVVDAAPESAPDAITIETGLIIPCNSCGNTLKEPGGLLFSPPDNNDMTVKWHICKICFPNWRRSLER